MSQSRSNSNQWFVCPRVNPSAETRLFIFPYAGGGPPAFSKWSAELPNMEVWIAHYPGRGSRFNEPPIKEFDVMVHELHQAIQSLLDKPFIFFGHSMGGLVAFELARKLHQLKILFLSACGAPQIPDSHPPIHTLPHDEFMKSLQGLNGIPTEVADNAELMELLLPILRADFEVIENYRYTSNDRLACPIIVFGGLADPRVNRERLEAWALHTNANFKSIYFPGDHFFINMNKNAIIAEIMSFHAKR